MLGALVLCMPLSWYMIENHGLTGAAFSVVMLEFLSLTLLNYGYQKGKILKMHLFVFSWLFNSIPGRTHFGKRN